MIYAVIDTNVLVSAIMTKNHDAATSRVLNSIFRGIVTPIYNDEIIEEYQDVLHRDYLKLDPIKCDYAISYIIDAGRNIEAFKSDVKMPDEDDRVFYEVTLASQDIDAKLVTGNIKHFPHVDFVLSPAEFCELIEKIQGSES